MNANELKDTTVCANCHKEFADHNYVPDSIDKYRCPVPQQETSYGYFPGGDPRLFHPDHESCSEDEIAAHKTACEAWDRGEKIETPPGCRFLTDCEGAFIGRVCDSRFGVGVYWFDIETFFEPVEADSPYCKFGD